MNAARSHAVLERVVWASFLFLIALAFSLSIQVQFTLPKLFWLRAISPLILLVWVVRFWRGDVRPIPRTILASLCALSGWWILTTFFSMDPLTAIQGMHGRYNGLLNQTILLLIFLAVASTAASRRDIETLLALLVSALVPVSIYAVVQNLGFDPLLWPNPRPGSTIGHPVPLAAILALAAPFVIAFLITERGARKRGMWAVILLLFLSASASTLSRGPWAGLAVAMGVVLVAAVRQRVIELTGVIDLKKSWIRDGDLGFAMVVLLAVLGLAWPPTAVSRFTSRLAALAHLETDPSFMNRFVYIGAASRMLSDHPIAGVGFESYGLLYPRYRPVEGETVPSDALPTMVHNGYLQMAVTNGLPAVGLYVTLLASIVLLLWRTYWRPPARAPDAASARELMIGVAFIGSIAGYLVQDLSGWQEISLSVFVWTLLGAAVSFCTAASPAKRSFPRPGWRVAGSMAAVAAAVTIAILAVVTLREVRADGLFFEAQLLDVSRDWPRIEENLTAGLRLVPDDPYYVDAAGVQYLKRLHESGQSQAYVQAAALFERAAQRNPFDPYILIHRIDTETTALQKKAVSAPSEPATRAVTSLMEMDPNNATAHESVARLRLAGARTEDALASIRKAEALRPHHPRYHMLEGDALRSLGDKAGAIESYRKEAAILQGPDDPDWVVAEDKLVLALAETGQNDTAAAEGRRVVGRVPSDVLAHTLLGFAYLGMNEVERARQSFAKALEIDPTNAGARRGLLETERAQR